ncbi:MAG: hypothetical protein V4717_17940 [Bacteroidota bacterium]
MRKLFFTLCFFSASIVAFSNTYYVSSAGDDNNTGLTTADPWASIAKVNSFLFAPGDSLLFKGGDNFTGSVNNFSLGQGTIAGRITIASYDSGKAIISSLLSNGLTFKNPANISIQNLIFKGSGYKIAGMTIYISGIDINVDTLTTALSENIVIDSVECFSYGGWGVKLAADSRNFGFKNLRVTNSLLHDNGIGGCYVSGYWDEVTESIGFINENVYIGYIKAYNNYGRVDYLDNWSGSGILVNGTTNGTIEYCEAYNNGKENGSSYAGPVGIFISDCKYVTIQYCISHHNMGGLGKRDGGGFDIDQGSYGCVVQYCNSYENTGAGYGLYQAPSVNTFAYDTIRYNTSTNDGRNYSVYGAFTFWGFNRFNILTTTQVYGNQINMNKPGYAITFLNNFMSDIDVHDNKFCIDPPGSYINYVTYPIPSTAAVYNDTFSCSVKQEYPFVSPVTYRGAFAPEPATMWTTTWTNYDPQNAVYGETDSVIQTDITTSITLQSFKQYLLKGIVHVKNGATLTIQPGCIIRGDKTVPNSSLIITKGSKIRAAGTQSKPIIFTSNQPAGARAAGDWGGLVILGKGRLNSDAGTAYLFGLPENPDNEFGGGANFNDNDSSGFLQYARIEFGGFETAGGNKISPITFGAVGRGTIIDRIQVSYSNEDAFRWNGGSVNCRYLVSYKNAGDNWHARNGYKGVVQFCLGLRDPMIPGNEGINSSDGIHTENDETGTDAAPFTSALFLNITEIGPLRGNTETTITSGYNTSLRFSNNSHARILNSIFLDYPTGVSVEGQASSANATGSYLSSNGSTSPGNLVFKNNLLAGNKSNQVLYTNTGLDMAQWFATNRNDSLPGTNGILINPYATTGTNVFSGDYRPAPGSAALVKYNWNDSAFYDIDSNGTRNILINCLTVPATPPIDVIAGTTNPYNFILSGDSGKYYMKAQGIFGVLNPFWTVSAGMTILSGQNTDTIYVKFANTFTTGKIGVQNFSYCGALGGTTELQLKKAAPVVYTFTGNGNWNINSNWSNNMIPPNPLPPLSEIIISPAVDGSCILNIPQTVQPGGKLTVQQDKAFVILGKLTVQ